MRRLFLLAALLFVLPQAASGDRDMSTPSARLVGHWESEAGDAVYYGVIDPSTGRGTYWLVQPDGGRAKHEYMILSETPNGDDVTIQLHLRGGSRRTERCRVQRNGVYLDCDKAIVGIQIESSLEYVDEATSP
jgi:hypothetical protein